MVFISGSTLRPLLFSARLLQWASAVVVMGIASYYIHNYGTNEHIIYEEVIATTATAFYLIPLFTTFLKRWTWHAIPLDLAYSYLYVSFPLPFSLSFLSLSSP